jgi:hypothetical protein
LDEDSKLIFVILQALEGNPVDVDAVIEVLMSADLSSGAMAASEAAALGLSFSPPPRQPASLPPPPGAHYVFNSNSII